MAVHRSELFRLSSEHECEASAKRGCTVEEIREKVKEEQKGEEKLIGPENCKTQTLKHFLMQ